MLKINKELVNYSNEVLLNALIEENCSGNLNLLESFLTSFYNEKKDVINESQCCSHSLIISDKVTSLGTDLGYCLYMDYLEDGLFNFYVEGDNGENVESYPVYKQAEILSEFLKAYEKFMEVVERRGQFFYFNVNEDLINYSEEFKNSLLDSNDNGHNYHIERFLLKFYEENTDLMNELVVDKTVSLGNKLGYSLHTTCLEGGMFDYYIEGVNCCSVKSFPVYSKEEIVPQFAKAYKMFVDLVEEKEKKKDKEFKENKAVKMIKYYEENEEIDQLEFVNNSGDGDKYVVDADLHLSSKFAYDSDVVWAVNVSRKTDDDLLEFNCVTVRGNLNSSIDIGVENKLRAMEYLLKNKLLKTKSLKTKLIDSLMLLSLRENRNEFNIWFNQLPKKSLEDLMEQYHLRYGNTNLTNIISQHYKEIESINDKSQNLLQFMSKYNESVTKEVVDILLEWCNDYMYEIKYSGEKILSFDLQDNNTITDFTVNSFIENWIEIIKNKISDVEEDDSAKETCNKWRKQLEILNNSIWSKGVNICSCPNGCRELGEDGTISFI